MIVSDHICFEDWGLMWELLVWFLSFEYLASLHTEAGRKGKVTWTRGPLLLPSLSQSDQFCDSIQLTEMPTANKSLL